MPRFPRILAALAAVLTLSGVAPAVAATPSPTVQVAAVDQCHGYLVTAGSKLKAKSGFRTEWLGTIKLAGQCGICIDYGMQGPDGRWASTSVSAIKDKRTRERVTWLANAYGADATRSDRQAAALKVAINRLVSADFRADWPGYAKQLKAKDAGVAPRSDEMLTASLAAGVVRVTATVTSKPKPGGVGVVEVKATGNGRPLAGQPVTWSTAGAKATSSATMTRADGTATLRLVWDGATALHVAATVASPEWRKAIYSTPSSGRRQHLVRGSLSVKSSARVGYDVVLGATITQDCSTTCDGKPPVTLAAKGAGAPTQWQALIGGTPVKTLTLAAGKSGSVLVPGAKDGDRITLRYRVQVAGKWSGWRTSTTVFDVICPPWPTVQLDCACAGDLTVSLTPPAGKRYYTATVGSKTAALAGRTTITTPLAAGESAAITVTAYSDAGHKHAIGTHTYGTWTHGR